MINESANLQKAAALNARYAEKFGLEPYKRQLKDILGYSDDFSSPRFARAVMDYQKKHGLEADGVFGPKTKVYIWANGSKTPHKKVKTVSAGLDVRDFKEKIANHESRGSGGYQSQSKHTSAVGKYQFLWKFWGPKIQQFSKKPQLTVQEYLNDAQLQENFMDYYIKDILSKEADKLMARYPDQAGRYSPAQLMALLHFKGYNYARAWIVKGEEHASANNKSIDDYLATFA